MSEVMCQVKHCAYCGSLNIAKRNYDLYTFCKDCQMAFRIDYSRQLRKASRKKKKQ